MIAAVAVEVSLPHLDRTFDYRVPEGMAVEVGVRVRVAFAGRLVSGIVLALHDDATHATAELRAVVSPEVVLRPDSAALVRAVATRYAGTFTDVLRFAVPPRHARSEASAAGHEPVLIDVQHELTGPLTAVRGLSAFLGRSARGEALRACLDVPTALDLPQVVAEVAAVAASSSSVIVVTPDARDVTRVVDALRTHDITAIEMRASDGPSVRQRAFTTVAHAARCVVVGTRSSVFAPVQMPGVCIVMGDGHDALVEPQSPGWHAREVALLRTQVQGWSMLAVAHHRSIEMQHLVHSGTVKSLEWSREQWRALSVQCASVPERYDDADPLLQRLRIPPSVFTAVREGLRTGPVLLSVAHRGYVTGVRCASCREIARCTTCAGPVGVAAEGEQPRCRICGTADWTCPWCGSTRVLFRTLGIERTREEVGRAFPGIPIRIIDAEHPLDAIPDTAQLLLCTPGMEPAGRLRLAVVLDVDTVLGRHDLAAPAEAVRRWHEVAATVRSDGRMMIVGSQTAAAVQALVRNDPVGFAERDLADRATAGLPPSVHAAVVQAPVGNQAAADIHAHIPQARMLGPVHAGSEHRWILLDADLAALCSAVRTVIARRSASKTLAGITVRIDPLELAT